MISDTIETRVLQMVAGEREWEHGSAVNACLEMLRNSGYITEYIGTRPSLTQRGRRAIMSEEERDRRASEALRRDQEELPGTIWRHLKSGRLYTTLHECLIESGPTPAIAYTCISTDDPRIWIRPRDEFLDGRFERIA